MSELDYLVNWGTHGLFKGSSDELQSLSSLQSVDPVWVHFQEKSET